MKIFYYGLLSFRGKLLEDIQCWLKRNTWTYCVVMLLIFLYISKNMNCVWDITLALLGECFPVSWRKVLPSFLWVKCTKKMMQHQVQQDHNYQLHCC